jgi:hypothetical protein
MDMALHAHRIHPDMDAWPITWPDGEPVAFEDPDLLAEG